MSKTIEKNKQKVMIKRLVWYFNLFWKFICTDKSNDKNKINLPLLPSTVFLIAEKLPSLLKFWDFHFNLGKIKSNSVSGLFCIGNLLKVDRKIF